MALNSDFGDKLSRSAPAEIWLNYFIRYSEALDDTLRRSNLSGPTKKHFRLRTKKNIIFYKNKLIRTSDKTHDLDF